MRSNSSCWFADPTMFLTPRWIASHVFVAVLVASFIIAGFWQVDRLGQRRDTNELVEARMTDAPTSLEALAGLPTDELEFRPIVVEGSYAPAEIFVANRTEVGSPGSWAWTGFRSTSGIDLIVNRGFVGRPILLESEGAVPLAEIAPPSGTVVLAGILRSGIDGGRVAGSGTEISRPDAALAARTIGVDPTLGDDVYLELSSQTPNQGSGFPRPVPAPDLGEGSHRSYAFQWFTFAALGVLGYGLALRRIHRGDETRGDVPPHLD